MTPTGQERAVAELLGTLYEQVDHLPRPMLEALTPALAQAQREVEKDLRAWLAREDGAARFTTQRLRRSLVQVRRTMERIRRDLDPALMKGMRIGANAAGKLATGHVTLEMERFGMMFRSPVVAPIALDEAAILARGRQLLAHRFRSSVATYSKEMRARIGSELAVAKLRGETIDEMTTRLSSVLSKVFRGERWRAERLARTETMHAYNLQHREGLLQLREHDDGIRMRWDAYFDRRTCLECLSLDGQIIDPAAKGAKFTSAWVAKSGKKMGRTTRVPPIHPNDRCVLVAWHRDWDDDAFRHDGPARERAMAGRNLAYRDLKPPNLQPTTIPHGWSNDARMANAGDTRGWPLVAGMPSPRDLDWRAKGFTDRLFVIPIDQLERAGIYANPGAVGDSKMAPLARARAENPSLKLPPLYLEMDAKGRLFVQEGRHRITTILEEGKNAPIVARIERRVIPAPNTGSDDAVRLVRRGGKVVEVPVKRKRK